MVDSCANPSTLNEGHSIFNYVDTHPPTWIGLFNQIGSRRLNGPATAISDGLSNVKGPARCRDWGPTCASALNFDMTAFSTCVTINKSVCELQGTSLYNS